MRTFKSIFNEALTYLGPVLKRAWGWGVFALGVDILLSYYVEFLILIEPKYYIGAKSCQLAVSITLAVFGAIIVNQICDDALHKRTTSVMAAIRLNLKFIFIETTRAMVPVLLKCLLLLIPGIIEGIRLYFVAYIVQFDERYHQGQLDALQHSRAICQGKLWNIFLILLLAAILSTVPEFGLGLISMAKQPFAFFFLGFISIVLSLYSYTLIYFLYRKLTEDKNGHSISL